MGRPEEVPLRPVENVHQPGDYGGNSVTLEIAPGVFAFYGHLQPGTIAVAVGDRVATGQVLGLLGNTGNSTAPPPALRAARRPRPARRGEPADGVRPLDLGGDGEPRGVLRTNPGRRAWPRWAPPEEQSASLQLFLDVADFG
jgi:hypothetical protein